MTDRTAVIEAEIRALIASDADAVSLSNALFTPSGLFAQLCESEAQRREAVESDLFQAAQARIALLRRTEAEVFSAVVDDATRRVSDANLFRIERV